MAFGKKDFVNKTKSGFTGSCKRFGFRSKNQLPWFMLWEEDWYEDDVVFARVLYSIGG